LWFLFLEALLSRTGRRVILVEFIRGVPRSRPRRALSFAKTKVVLAPLLKRTLLKAQILTQNESERYSNLFGIREDRFVFIPWPLHGDGSPARSVHNAPATEVRDAYLRHSELRSGAYVMCSGKSGTDWATLFEAAKVSSWQLLVVCSRSEFERVRQLDRHERATVLCDIPVEQHDLFVRNAALYVLCLPETGASLGQIRLMEAIGFGVPVVASRVSGLDGYAVDGVTAVVVAPGDPSQLKQAIDRLLSSPSERANLVRAARAYEPARDFSRYLADMRCFFEEAHARALNHGAMRPVQSRRKKSY
jgi:glycosyltransferase involved in cell wall biosynthesis